MRSRRSPPERPSPQNSGVRWYVLGTPGDAQLGKNTEFCCPSDWRTLPLDGGHE
jgi:hypothetical protein